MSLNSEYIDADDEPNNCFSSYFTYLDILGVGSFG